MDPLVPVFQANDWIVAEKGVSKIAFLKKVGDFSFGCEVQSDAVIPDGLCFSVSTSLLFKLKTDASEEVVNDRLHHFTVSSGEFFERELFLKKINTFWFPESSFLQIAVACTWVGHQSMLAMPYEMYEVSTGAPCHSHMGFLNRVKDGVKDVLSLSDDFCPSDLYDRFYEIALPAEEKQHVKWVDENKNIFAVSPSDEAAVPANSNKNLSK